MGPQIALLALLLVGGAEPDPVDLIILEATLFDSRSGTTRAQQQVVIDGGLIQAILPAGHELPDARKTLSAEGRLLTPGFIDVHHHSSFLLGDSVTAGGGVIATLSMDPDSLDAYRRIFADAYLPFGVTTVREAGEDDRYQARMVNWMQPVAWAPDFFASGGALVSHDESRLPYAGHTVVADPHAAAAKVSEYHVLGYRHVKLYWRLREPEFLAAYQRIVELEMVPYAHIDFGILTIGQALDIGVREFEHAYTLIKDVLTREDDIFIWNERTQALTQGRREALFFVDTMEKLNHLGPDHPGIIELIDRLAREDAAVTPTLHVFAKPYGLTYFQSEPWGTFDDTSTLSDTLMARGEAGYRILETYTRRLFDAGVRINLGTDVRDPGKAAISEMMLLHDAGIPMEEVLRIATWNGAVALDEIERIGSIEPGKKAHLVLFDASPLEDAANLLLHKTVIKDGVILEE